ncbi:MAG: NAD(P)/FAD-dependent oxidoreductase [Flavobacteriaceae bacterium]
MALSYWEYKSWLSNIDFTIVGSGIVGLNCALQLRKRYPNAKILILERGTFPQGASTKNAGFACFGSISEVLADLEIHSEEEMVSLVKRRWEGIQLLRQTIGDSLLHFQQLGGHEIFHQKDSALYEKCASKLAEINALLHPIFGGNPYAMTENKFGFASIAPKYISHRYEGQIDTGEMMNALLQKTQKAGITILNSVEVTHFQETGNNVSVKTEKFEFTTQRLYLAINGFAKQLLKEEVRPARAQVLLTKPINGLLIRGTFHLDRGYYYFRNINGRILLGGGRNLDLRGEETPMFGHTQLIQGKLEELLSNVILPNHTFEIAQRWSGIMGVGPQKSPIVKASSDRIFYGIRLGGMGIALGSLVGRELAELA